MSTKATNHSDIHPHMKPNTQGRGGICGSEWYLMWDQNVSTIPKAINARVSAPLIRSASESTLVSTRVISEHDSPQVKTSEYW